MEMCWYLYERHLRHLELIDLLIKKTLTKHWWDIAAYYYDDDGGAISNYKKVVFWDQVHEDASAKELDEATKHT